ncbi:MAG: Serine-type D-Ala-D-Ala carboxypeptidase [Ferruginibacter sp.]|nr:Serine-type D-Ala-D-Ala carboxypeptidase [Ferruginibacter sp.]
MKNTLRFVPVLLGSMLMVSCSVSKKISRQAKEILLQDSAIMAGHIGISIYEPATGKYWYEHDADKYFVPASNTKLFTLYAGMKYLGDSILSATIAEDAGQAYLFPNADPTVLNSEFSYQPLMNFLKTSGKSLSIVDTAWRESPLGYGWAWDDYAADYMTERSSFPVFANAIQVKGKFADGISPKFFTGNFKRDSLKNKGVFISDIQRDIDENIFTAESNAGKSSSFAIPYKTKNGLTNFNILQDEAGRTIPVQHAFRRSEGMQARKIYSVPADSLFKTMMHRSDNFFAEQTLLMVSNTKLGYMRDGDIINEILKTDLSTLPQKPKWVDGSGLSRYNLFTPKDFVFLLDKMKKEFAWSRLTTILATGGSGTIKNYFLPEANMIFAKTGTLSNNCALSGYLITKKNKLLIFSILNNNYQTGAAPVRRQVEKFLQTIRNNN